MNQKEIINVFQEDVANLNLGKRYFVFDPNNGNKIHKKVSGI